MNKKIVLFLICAAGINIIINSLQAQCTDWKQLQVIDSIFTNPFFGISTTPEADKLNRPIEYVASVSGGLKIYNNNDAGNPILLSTIPKSNLGNLDVINLYQDSIWLYVCLGNIWDTTEMAGLAIIDVTNPSSPQIMDYYIYPGLTGGSGAVAIQGPYAYLAANKNGLIILDISNKNKIQFKSKLILDQHFPHSKTGSTSLYNARGIALQGHFAYVCFDRGGLRIIDISDANAPIQINQYCFPALIDKATAYNNIVIHNHLAFVSIDYYGMEILDISNPKSIVQLGWWHPNSWAEATNDFIIWSNSAGHANELAYDLDCNIIYIAAGKSDLVAIDVSDPQHPQTCQTYGTPDDDYGTWGLDFYNHKVHISYIWSPVTPPHSNYTGFKILQTNCTPTDIKTPFKKIECSLYPNPTLGPIHINTFGQNVKAITILNPYGQVVQTPLYLNNEISLADLPTGIYYINIQTQNSIFLKKLFKR